MWFRLLWNFEFRPRPESEGSFKCPTCATERPYTLLEYRRWFELIRVPIIRLKDSYHRVHCNGCGREFEDFVLG